MKIVFAKWSAFGQQSRLRDWDEMMVSLAAAAWSQLLCPQLGKSWWGILLACACVCPSVMLFYATCNFGTVHARVLKFHIWIPHGKITDQYFFLVLVISLFGIMPLLKRWDGNLVSEISQKLFGVLTGTEEKFVIRVLFTVASKDRLFHKKRRNRCILFIAT